MQVSPIEYGHVLLVPRVLDCLPQRIDQDTFLLALHMAAEANNPYFRLGYNSLGAFATINHLHFQVCFMLGISRCTLLHFHSCIISRILFVIHLCDKISRMRAVSACSCNCPEVYGCSLVIFKKKFLYLIGVWFGEV